MEKNTALENFTILKLLKQSVDTEVALVKHQDYADQLFVLKSFDKEQIKQSGKL